MSSCIVRPYVGFPGALMGLECVSSLGMRRPGQTVFSTSAGGSVRALLPARREPRAWSVSTTLLRPDEVAPLMELITTTRLLPKVCWVSPWAMVTNLLTPEASMMESSLTTTVGRFPLVEGGFVLQAGAAVPSIVTKVGAALVYPGLPVTVSIYAAGDQPVLLTARLLDTNGGSVSTHPVSLPAPGLAALSRVSVTIPDVPVSAVMVAVEVQGATLLARPAVTWTGGVREWGIGDGCHSAVLESPDAEVDLISDEPSSARNHFPRLQSVSFSVVEVGN